MLTWYMSSTDTIKDAVLSVDDTKYSTCVVLATRYAEPSYALSSKISVIKSELMSVDFPSPLWPVEKSFDSKGVHYLTVYKTDSYRLPSERIGILSSLIS